RWYENHKDNITATTQEGYKYTLRILKDHFGRRKLSEIKAMDIELFLKNCAEMENRIRLWRSAGVCCIRFSTRPLPTTSS
ncbi:MAG: hypothetical protein IJW94_01025, partial [Oscillospiraceae bacterium]|nr:hypothetical protein [Oscillospiraceae bacterium]